MGTTSPPALKLRLSTRPANFANNPTAPPTLGAFTFSPSFRLVFDNGVPKDVTGGLGTLTAVPLPPAVILFGAGLVALIGLGARNWQRASSLRLRLRLRLREERARKRGPSLFGSFGLIWLNRAGTLNLQPNPIQPFHSSFNSWHSPSQPQHLQAL